MKDPIPDLVEFDESVWCKTVSFRFNKNVLEQKWCAPGKVYSEVWRPVPHVEDPPVEERSYIPPVGSYLGDVVQFEGPNNDTFRSQMVGFSSHRTCTYKFHTTYNLDRRVALEALYNEVRDSRGETHSVVWWRIRPRAEFLAAQGFWRAVASWVCLPPGVYPAREQISGEVRPWKPGGTVTVVVGEGNSVRTTGYATSAGPDRMSGGMSRDKERTRE